MRKKRLLPITFIAALLLGACASSSSGTDNTSADAYNTSGSAEVSSEAASTNKITLKKDTTETGESLPETTADAEANRKEITGDFKIDTEVSDGYTIDGNTVTITKGGEYVLSGALNGNIVVNAAEDEKVELMLAGVSITSSNASPIYAVNADKLTITAKGGTFNEIIDERTANADTDEGSGAEDASVGNAAIYSAVDMNIKGQGTLIVTASYNNGIQSKKDLEVKNLTLKCTAVNNVLKGNDSLTIESGGLTLISTQGDGLKTSDSDVKDSGKQEGIITVSGGSISITAADDGINAAYSVIIDGGNIDISAGGDGIHSDGELNINDGSINIIKSKEGLEGSAVTVDGGNVYVYSTDDGINACGTTSSDSGFGRGGMGGMSYVSDARITINGGSIYVKTSSGDTDGIDSNGDFVQTGGYLVVAAGAGAGSVCGSVDVNGSITISGGSTVALGGICELPENSVNTYVLDGVSLAAGEYVLKDADGDEILSFETDSTYSAGWIASDRLITGEEYSLSKDGSSVASWTQEEGTMGSAGVGGFGKGGFTGGRGGMQRPEGGMQRSEGEMQRPEGFESPNGEMQRPEGFEIPEGMELPEGQEGGMGYRKRWNEEVKDESGDPVASTNEA